MKTKVEILKELALKLTSAESVDEIQGETISDVLMYIKENFTSVSGAKGEDGRGITNIERTGTSGLIDTYTITYSDNTTSTFEVTNGQDGSQGAKGEDGRGITNIEKTGTSGLVDTYTITYSDSTTSTFEVTNGQEGSQGEKGVSVKAIKLTKSSEGEITGGTVTYSDDSTSEIEVTTEVSE